jgi:hypothetical protein
LPTLEAGALFVAADVVAGAGIGVIAAGAPIAAAPGARRALRFQRFKRRFGRVPEFAAIEPAQDDVGLFALQLMQRRQEVCGLLGAKRRRRRAGDDHPHAVFGHGQFRSSFFRGA